MSGRSEIKAVQTGALTPTERFAVLSRDGFCCTYCGARSPEARLHVDHVIPRARGGSNDPHNLVTACDVCNQGKRDKLLPRQWRGMYEFSLAGRVLERAAERFQGRLDATGVYEVVQSAFNERVSPQLLDLVEAAVTFDELILWIVEAYGETEE